MQSDSVSQKVDISLSTITSLFDSTCIYTELPELNTLRTGSFKLFKRPFPGV